jgi:predicted nucleic acid-binding protein
MVKSILDTDILSEYLKGHHPAVISHAARYTQEHGIFTFTSVTVYEIVYGLELKAASSQLKRALAWLNQNEEITPTSADYLTAATIKATARKEWFCSRTSRLLDRCRSRQAGQAARHQQHRGFSGDSKDRDQSNP